MGTRGSKLVVESARSVLARRKQEILKTQASFPYPASSNDRSSSGLEDNKINGNVSNESSTTISTTGLSTIAVESNVAAATNQIKQSDEMNPNLVKEASKWTVVKSKNAEVLLIYEDISYIRRVI